MTGVLVVIVAVIGLVIGSFLNVVIWRLPRKESLVRPGSHCPACGTAVRPRDNVPVVSWLLLRGRCRSCAAPISPRYPLVEVLTAAVFVALAVHFGARAVLPAYLYLAAVGVALAAIDLDLQRLPDRLTLPSYAVGIVLLGAAAAYDGQPWALVRGLIGMAALFAFYFILVLVQPRGMGFGDVKLAGVLGLYLGFLGWGALVVGAFAGFLLGGVFSVGLLVFAGAGRKTKVPFGPFMLAGALVAILAGEHVAASYLHVTRV